MFIKNYLLTILLLSFVCLISSQETSTIESTDTTFESSSVSATVVASSTDTVTSTELNSETTVISSTNDETDNTSDGSESTNLSNTVITATASGLSTAQVSSSTDDASDSSETSESTNLSNTVITSAANGLSTSQISTSSSTPDSTGIITTYTATTAGLMTNIIATFQYSFESDIALNTTPITNGTYLDQVQRLVNGSFNLTGASYTALQARLESLERKSISYNLLVDILFKSSRNYSLADIENAAKKANVNITLPGANGTVANIYTIEAPTRVSVTTSTYPPGGPSPGIPGQLGMGLGISFIGVLLIGEIIFLVRKYGFSNTSRREQYAMTSY